MNLKHIEIIVAIEKAGSLRRAAEALGRTQPALTKALRQAEADLGAAIFLRGPSGVSLTAQGRVILQRAKIIQSEVTKLHAEVRQIQGDMVGTLNIIVSPLAASKIVPAALRRFRRRYDRVQVQISGGHEPQAFAPLRTGEADLVIGPAPLGAMANGLKVTEIVRTPIAIVAGRNSRFAKAKSILDLADAEWIMIGPKERRSVVAQHFSALGIPAPMPYTTSDSIVSILAMLSDSDMVCTFPALILDEFEQRWPIVRLPIEEEFPPTPIAITHSAELPLSPAGRFFLDCAITVAKALPGAKGYSQKLSG